MPIQRVEIETRAGLSDALATQTQQRVEAWLGLKPRRVRTRKVYHFDLGLQDDEAQRVLEALVDPVAEVGALGMLPDDLEGAPIFLTVGFLPGVTDSVGTTVKRAAQDTLGRSLPGRAYGSTQYVFWGLSESEVELAARRLLHNPLIERIVVQEGPRELDLEVPKAGAQIEVRVESIPLRGADDETLLRLSAERTLALDATEMRAIAQHFEERERDPTDAELECLAQTWSEHCKHKIFSAPIEWVNADGTSELIEGGLFKTFIRGATEAVQEQRRERGLDEPGASFLVSVFHDNAGVVRCTEQDHLVYKVETHNSPSALDPYGGAMTGIVGVNRDSFGTGLGADLLTNVWGYCFGDPRYDGHLPAGLMHPRRIRDGVHHGVVDGGNQSGVPYSRGWELFDERYLGKPLVFCGTVAVMPATTAERPTHQKRIAKGDKVVMIGGRIGKDGIHGATFSSVRLDETAPVQAVQIGDPITQKMMFDMLTEARDRGLMSGMTDNGAGGLSSSVGEMAEATGGASIDLALAPLKYPGLEPWEILISEAQERMTVAIPPEHLDAFLELAARREVEASVLGEFTDDGRFHVTYGEQPCVDLPLEFLHEGLPRTTLRARLEPPKPQSAKTTDAVVEAAADEHLTTRLLELLESPNVASGESRARSYDHEVKGLSVIKPIIGVDRDVPSNATVMRIRHGRPEGVVLAEGVHPHYSDLDSEAMAHACVDEAVRRLIAAGARSDRLSALDNFCWPDPVQSDRTPDGEHKLAQLVACCRGLRAACEAYGLPLISGKDSMKNDAFLDGVKISIPPTLLVSAMGQIDDVSKALSLEPRAQEETLFLLGPTRDELGGSEIYRRLGIEAGRCPKTDLKTAAERYLAFEKVRDAGFVSSAQAIGRGGLALALARVVMASHRSLEVFLDASSELSSPFVALFSESTGRIAFTTRPEDAESVRASLAGHGLLTLGSIGPQSGKGRLVVRDAGRVLIDVTGDRLSERHHATLEGL